MIAKISRNFSRFLHWWGRELAFLVPDKFSAIINENRGQLIVYAGQKEVTLTLLQKEHAEQLATLPLNELGREEYLTLLEGDSRLAKADIIIRLAKDQAVKKVLALPLAAEENLEQVVAYEMDKYTPFKADDVYFSVRPLDKDTTTGQISALLVLTPCKVLDHLIAELKTWGMVPLIADSEVAANDLAQYYDVYNLLPETERLQADLFSRVLNPSIALILLLLLGSVLALPIWMQAQTVELLQSQMHSVAKDADTVEKQRAETDRLLAETQQLIDSKNTSASVLSILESLSKLISDDTWLTHFRFSNGTLQIQGQSPGASGLIELLETSTLFSNVHFVSPVTQDKRSGLERFQISATVNQLETQNNVLQ